MQSNPTQNLLSNSVSEMAFEGGDKSSRDGVIDISLRLQQENKQLKERLDLLQHEKTAMFVEMQQLRDRERIAVDEAMFKETRLQGLDSEMQLLKIERTRAQEDLARERTRIGELTAQLQTQAYKIENMTS